MSIEDRLRDAVDRALAEARAQLEPDLRALTHELSDAGAAALLSGAEALDRAASLGDVLRTLFQTAAQSTERVGLFLVRNGHVRPWQLNGIDMTAFSSVEANRLAAFPVTVGGQVVAILCADAPPSRASGLDVMTRYAGRLLESKTLHMALGIPAR